MLKKKERNQALDGLKGIAIFNIIAYYFFQYLVPGGYLAVNAFLFIAGFLNFRTFYKAQRDGYRIRSLIYYKRRFTRLFFPMLAVVLGTASYILLFNRNFLFNLRNMGLASLLFVNNLYQIMTQQSYFVEVTNPSAYTHLWYVALLGQMLLLTPLLYRLVYTWHKKANVARNILLALSLLSALFMAYMYTKKGDPSFVYYHPATRAFAYTLGGAVAFLYPANFNPQPLKFKLSIFLNVLSFVSFALLIMMNLFMYGTQAFAYHIGMALYTLVFAVFFITIMHPSTLMHKVLSLEPLAWLGRRSYSYYLVYYPVYLLGPDLLKPLQVSLLVSNVMQIVIVIGLAEVVYQMFERERLQLPLGQDFNWKKMRHQLTYLWHAKGQLTTIKGLTLGYILMSICGITALALAPEQKETAANDLQTTIDKNKELIEKARKEEEKIKVINNIEGLTQQELLFSNGLDISFIGDSILAASVAEIQNVFPKADIEAEVGRQLYNSSELARSLNSTDRLEPIVVSMLGANGTFAASQIDDYIRAVGTDKKHFFVTSNAQRPWVEDANRQIKKAAERFDNVYVIDWATYAANQVGWLREDTAHPTTEGALQLANYIAKEIYRLR